MKKRKVSAKKLYVASLKEDLLVITKAADALSVGIEHFEKTGSVMSTPSFIQQCVDSYEMIVTLIDAVLSELDADRALLREMYDESLSAAVNRVQYDLINNYA